MSDTYPLYLYKILDLIHEHKELDKEYKPIDTYPIYVTYADMKLNVINKNLFMIFVCCNIMIDSLRSKEHFNHAKYYTALIFCLEWFVIIVNNLEPPFDAENIQTVYQNVSSFLKNTINVKSKLENSAEIVAKLSPHTHHGGSDISPQIYELYIREILKNINDFVDKCKTIMSLRTKYYSILKSNQDDNSRSAIDKLYTQLSNMQQNMLEAIQYTIELELYERKDINKSVFYTDEKSIEEIISALEDMSLLSQVDIDIKYYCDEYIRSKEYYLARSAR